MKWPRHAALRAVALPLVLWGIAFLSGLVIMASTRVKDHIEQETRSELQFRAMQLALRGIALGMHPDIEEADPLLSQFDEEAGEGFRVEIKDEAGRINPNAWIARGDRDIFHRIFGAWGVPLQQADAAIDALTDWIDDDDLRGLAGAELPEYTMAGFEGLPANAPLASVREMEAVLNLRDILAGQDRWEDLFTVYRRGKINVNHADPPVLAAVGGLDEMAIDTILTFRHGEDGIDGTGDDGEFSSIEEVMALTGLQDIQAEQFENYFQTSGSIRRVESTGVCQGVERKVVVVVDRSGKIRAWEEG